MNTKWQRTLIALGVLYLLMSFFLPINVKAKNLIQTTELPCLLKPNPGYVIALNENGGSIGFEFGESYGGFMGLDVHNGIDWTSGGKVLPIFAGADGVVELKVDTVEEDLWRTGGKIIIRLNSPPEFLLMYFHMDYLENTFVSLQEGQQVQKGQLIGFLAPDEWDPILINPADPGKKVSRMGYYASHPHLHVQVRLNGVLIDPLPMFKEECSVDAVVYTENLSQIILPQGSIDPLLGSVIDLPVNQSNFEIPVMTPDQSVQSTSTPTATQTAVTSIVQDASEDDWMIRDVPWNGVYYDIDVRKMLLIIVVLLVLPVLTGLLIKVHRS